MDLETLLYDEIETLYEKLRTLTPGTDEHRAVLDEVAKLTDRAIEMRKIEVDCENKTAVIESEQAMKQQQLDNEQAVNQQKMKDENVDRIVRNIISAAGIVLPLIVTIWGTKVSLKFEETGTVTTQMGRGFIQRLFPKK